MKKDTFFSQERCDRCLEDLKGVRIMSWFTNQTICMECAEKEDKIKKQLRESGDTKSYEGCGFVPEVKKVVLKVKLSENVELVEVEDNN